MREQVVVTELGAGGVWVEGVQSSACESCQAKSGCGQQSLKKLGRPVSLWIKTDLRLQVGDQVVVELPDGAVAMSAMVLYGVPLAGLAIGAVIANHFGFADWQAFIGACIGLGAGFFVARVLSERYQERWLPQLVTPTASTIPKCFSDSSTEP